MLWMVAIAFAGWPCHAPGVEKVANAVAWADAGVRVELAAKGLAEECTLPEAVERALDARARGEAAGAPLVRAALAEPALAGACTGGAAALAEADARAPEARRGAVWDACGLGRYGLVDRAAFVAGTGDALLFVLAAHAAGDAVADPNVAVVLRAIAGVPLGRADEPRPAP